MPTNSRTLTIFRTLACLSLLWTVNSHAQTPVINGVTVEIAANTATATLTITGTQLCVTEKKQPNACKLVPIVTLANQATTLISATPTQVVTTSTIVDAGSYTLRLNNGQGKSFISYGLTIAGLNIPGRGDLNATVSTCLNTPVSAQAYIPGLSSSGYTDENGAILLKDIPVGTHQLVVEKKTDATVNTTQSIDINAGQVTNAGTVILENFISDNQNCGMCGLTCNQNQSCTGGQCVTIPSCSDNLKNGTETDTDCGGVCSNKCAVGNACSVDADCTTGICTANVCTL